MSSHLYRELEVWERARRFVGAVYRASMHFPRTELYGLTAQLRRAVISVPSNVAEGNGSGYRDSYAHHVAIAHGSLMEAETQLIIAHDLSYLRENELNALVSESEHVGFLLRRLRQSLRQDIR